MSFAIEQRAERLNELLSLDDVREAMKEHCEETGHNYENCYSFTFQVYQRCKWCGETR